MKYKYSSNYGFYNQLANKNMQFFIYSIFLFFVPMYHIIR